ncbi:MAG: type II toxin-antitoxin system VapC family toxin [Acidimicrobiia bacterium]|nr:type II toxin-antitoxin system VapC family toxin [Acidimicrobiia bacterium]MBA3955638.1 type II toxin-antitoxin system VapC family toxin [Acidimicrobiia bacterium]
MRLLLDTHPLLWWLDETPMTPTAHAGIVDPSVKVLVSGASIWEIAIKEASGKLRVDGRVIDHVERKGFDRLLISFEHAERAGSLPLHHKDPFDRLLIAQAQLEDLTVVTRDRSFEAYDVAVLRC